MQSRICVSVYECDCTCLRSLDSSDIASDDESPASAGERRILLSALNSAVMRDTNVNVNFHAQYAYAICGEVSE
jgi:hypothetical protein